MTLLRVGGSDKMAADVLCAEKCFIEYSRTGKDKTIVLRMWFHGFFALGHDMGHVCYMGFFALGRDMGHVCDMA